MDLFFFGELIGLPISSRLFFYLFHLFSPQVGHQTIRYSRVFSQTPAFALLSAYRILRYMRIVFSISSGIVFSPSPTFVPFFGSRQTANHPFFSPPSLFLIFVSQLSVLPLSLSLVPSPGFGLFLIAHRVVRSFRVFSFIHSSILKSLLRLVKPCMYFLFGKPSHCLRSSCQFSISCTSVLLECLIGLANVLVSILSFASNLIPI
ncbi:hypothetical protein K432DRAFT_154557 [Lepidopterella palustris CBS 459.81]|uniref:Uncharacterized protein n=1 Tax=Lepidopterella palustris CBS 459.81 TaxID=1314670 RepID=A0A8E2JIR7_9PEZI|nr:hypothetical protein K432DRAFT_154557 [Lepidopterella palustris CBS 459.81]